MSRSRTIWFAVLLAVLSVLQGFVLQLPLAPAHQALLGCVIAAVVAVLRVLTTQPLSQR